MIRYENQCVGCGLPCLGSGCPYRNVPVYECDDCHDEFDPEDLRDVDGEMICERCLLNRFPKISV